MTAADFQLLESQYNLVQKKLEAGRTLTRREYQVAQEYNAALDKMAEGVDSEQDTDLDLNFGVQPHLAPSGVFDNGIQGVGDDLGFVEPPAELTQAEKKFILAYAQAIPTREAYLAAFNSKKISYEKMWTHIRELLQNPVARKYLDDLNKRVEDVAVATKLQIEMYLTAAMKATLQNTGTDSPFCRKAVVRRTYDKEGNIKSQNLTREIINPMDAVKLLNRMRGYDQPIQMDINHGGGVMVVPMTSSDEEWANLAEQQQQKLIDETIDV